MHGSLRGGAAPQSGAIVAQGALGTLHVFQDVRGAAGQESGEITAASLGTVLIGGLVGIFSVHYALFALAAILAHYAADIGSTVGLPLLWPFSKRKFTLALFQDSGYWGKEMYTGYYRQPMSWVLEGTVVLFLAYRLYVLYA